MALKVTKLQRWLLVGELQGALKASGLSAWRHGMFVDTDIAGVVYELTIAEDGPRAVEELPDPIARIVREVWAGELARMERERADRRALTQDFLDAMWDAEHTQGSPRIHAGA